MKTTTSRFFLIASLSCFATLAHAATVTVTNTSDSDSGTGSLRAAVASAATGDTINFTIPTTDSGYNAATGAYTISLSTAGDQTFGASALLVNKTLTIDGGFSRITIIRNGTAQPAPRTSARSKAIPAPARSVQPTSVTTSTPIVRSTSPTSPWRRRFRGLSFLNAVPRCAEARSARRQETDFPASGAVNLEANLSAAFFPPKSGSGIVISKRSFQACLS